MIILYIVSNEIVLLQEVYLFNCKMLNLHFSERVFAEALSLQFIYILTFIRCATHEKSPYAVCGKRTSKCTNANYDLDLQCSNMTQGQQLQPTNEPIDIQETIYFTPLCSGPFSMSGKSGLVY